MKAKSGFAVREICGEYLLIPLGDNALTYSEMIATNEVGASIWNHLQTEHTRDELVDLLFDEYDVEKDVLEEDVDNFISRMKELKLLED